MTRVHCMLRLNNESIQVGPNQWAPIWWTNANSVEEFDTHQAHNSNFDAFKIRIPKTAQYRVECGISSAAISTARRVLSGFISTSICSG